VRNTDPMKRKEPSNTNGHASQYPGKRTIRSRDTRSKHSAFVTIENDIGVFLYSHELAPVREKKKIQRGNSNRGHSRRARKMVASTLGVG
jgi:hypothetical protein